MGKEELPDGSGVVKVYSEGFNQAGKVVVSLERRIVVPGRPQRQ
jgi:acyl dehydratase